MTSEVAWDHVSYSLEQPVKEKLSGMTQAEMCSDEVMYESFVHVMFSHVPLLPSSLPDTSSELSTEVIATGDQIKKTVTVSNSRFQHC